MVMGSGLYQILLLGSDDERRVRLQGLLVERMRDLGLDPATMHFIDGSKASERDRGSPQLAIFFGSSGETNDTQLIAELIEDSIVIVPLVSAVANVHLEIPPQLRRINALEVGFDGNGFERLVSLVLEIFRLLRRERKLFISYRREDARPFAERLYDALDARGFDVFLDLRSVPPAVDFQEELWHRMSDSDVVVLIDTPGFRESRWTTEELAKANATNIQILHLLWPGQKEDGTSSFSHFMKLDLRDFEGSSPGQGGEVREDTLVRICDAAERLRARAIAARYRYLTDNFCDAARDLRMTPVVQPEHWISLDGFNDGRNLAVVPAVGIPTSVRINEIFDAVANSTESFSDVWIVYDNRGVLEKWLSHLDWLDKHLPIRTVQMVKAPGLLREVIA